MGKKPPQYRKISIVAIEHILNCRGGAPARLYLALQTYADINTGACYPSRETLMKRAGIKKNHTFSRAVKDLIRTGLVVRKKMPPKKNEWPKPLYIVVRWNALNGHAALLDAQKGTGTNYSAQNGHIERSEKEERSKDELFIPSKETLAKYASYDKELVDVALKETVKAKPQHPDNYFEKVCANLLSRRVEREAEENRIQWRRDANRVSNPILSEAMQKISGNFRLGRPNEPR